MDAKVTIELSAAGQKDALARGLSAEREQTIIVPAGNGDLKYFNVEAAGALSLKLISAASVTRQYGSWKNLAWDIYPSADDILDFLHTREEKRAAILAAEQAEKDQKALTEKKRYEDAYAKFSALTDKDQEAAIDSYYKNYASIDSVVLKAQDYPLVAAACARQNARIAAEEAKAKRLKKIPPAAKLLRTTLSADGRYQFTVPNSTVGESWSKQVTSVNSAKRGGYALEGPWLNCSQTALLEAGELVAVGGKKWEGSRKRGSYAIELNLYIVTPAGLIFDRANNEINRAAELVALTSAERIEQALKARAKFAQEKIDALLAQRVAGWREVKAACERALQGVDPESNIQDIDSAAGAIVAAGYRELAKKHHPDAGGAAETMALINAAKKQLVEILNAARGVK